MKRANPGKVKMSSTSPTKPGGKVVQTAAPKSTKTANNTTNRTAKLIKR